MSRQTTPVAETAAALLAAMTRLRARLRTESAPDEVPASWSQLTTLHRVTAEEPVTIGDLARAEHVRRQSMTETVAGLRRLGLVETAKDPDDARRTLVRASPEGRALMAAVPLAREAWIEAAVLAHTSPREQEILHEAAAIMNRLADCEL